MAFLGNVYLHCINVKEREKRKMRGIMIERVDKLSGKGMKEIKDRAKGGEG
jgi:hypothetical protein